MVRRASLCSSDLPSATHLFDLFFSAHPNHPGSHRWTPSKARSTGDLDISVMASSTSDSDSWIGSLALAQLDGTSAKRKVKKAEKKKKKKQSKKNNNNKESEKKDGDGNVESVQSQQGEEEAGKDKAGESSQSPKVHQVIVVHGDHQGSSQGHIQNQEEEQEQQQQQEQVEENEIGNESNDRPPSPASVATTFRNEKETENADTDAENNKDKHKVVCRVHGRLQCQFNAACCVHKPSSDCSCPPRRSCCCMHHAGDCCHCLADTNTNSDNLNGNATVTQDEVEEAESDESKTLSAATPPSTTSAPTINGAANTADAAGTVPTSASASTPAKPSGVTVMVTPASPSPLKPVEPVVMGAAEERRILAAQASLDLSTALLTFMEFGQMTDIRIVLRSATEQFWPIILTAHKCVLFRSPLVASLLHSDPHAQEIVALACENFSMIKPWEQSIHFLYGKPVVTQETLKPVTLEGLGYDPSPDPGCEPEYPFALQSAMLDMALGYAVCGAFFYLPSIIDSGCRLAIDLLSWETVEHVLHFGLCTYKFAVILPQPLVQARPQAKAKEAQAPASSTDDVPGQDGKKTPEKKKGKGKEKATSADASNAGPAKASASTSTAASASSAASPANADATAPAPADAEPAPYVPYPIMDLQTHWSPRFIAAALNFVVDHVKPDFKLYYAAKSDVVPDRIPEYLYNVPPPTTTNTAEKNAGKENNPSSSSAVVNKPGLAEVKSGCSLEKDQVMQKKKKKADIDDNNNSKNVGGDVNDDRRKKENDKPSTGKSTVALAVPGPEITIPSAILLTLPFQELQLAFTMMSNRGVLSTSLAQAIILEREARRRRALKNYALSILASHPSTNPATNANANANANANSTANSGGGPSAGPGTGSGSLGKKVKAKRGKDKEDVNVSVVSPPDAVRQLCYREFYSSKFTGRSSNKKNLKNFLGGGEGDEVEAEVEIALEREWVGLEY